jgi:hypothetical protein
MAAELQTLRKTIERLSMTDPKDAWKVQRRQFLQSTAAVVAGLGCSSFAFGQICPPKTGTVRDRLWVFCNPRNADYNMVRQRSVMSSLESAVYFGIPNIHMVNQYPGGREISRPGSKSNQAAETGSGKPQTARLLYGRL